MGGDPGPVRITAPSGREQQVAAAEDRPGLFRAQVRTTELGLHTLRSGDLVAFASVGAVNPRELADVFSDTERLRPVTEATGGSVRRVAGDSGPPTLPRIQTVRSGSRSAGADWIGIRPKRTRPSSGASP